MKKFLSVALALLMLAVMLPTTALAAGKPVKVGETEYDTLEAAIAVAEPVNGVITYEITGKVTVDSTGWVQVAKAGLTGPITKVEFVGITDDAEIVIRDSKSILADQKYDIDVSFKNLTLSHPNGEWVQDCGHATNYFTCWLRNTNAADNTVTYTNCTFPNGVCNNQYGKTIFDNCNFTNNTSGLYNLWNYGGNTEIKNSTFTGTRGVKLYSEGTSGGTVDIDNTKFDGLTEKAAVIASKPVEITITKVTVEACNKGFITRDITGKDELTLNVNGSDISGTFNVTNATSAEAAKTELKITEGTFTGNTDSVKDYLPEGKTINSSGAVVDKTITIIVPGDTTPETPKTDDQKNPATGANDMVAAAAALMAVAALGMSILSRKK
ncbi:MAG: right-handed parallel beta-helix repeat-containing protein [Ruminococcaceae bacterium]|nr:right-handed parallel beta-helix repeat-containing protein [Oscillospiraceae bacterium]